MPRSHTEKQLPRAEGPTGEAALPAHTLEEIRQYDTCTIANAIERFGIRLRNEGFSRPGGLWQMTGDSVPLLGYAATFLIRSSDPPMAGNSYLDRTDWWRQIALLPVPRVAAIHDLEAEPETPLGSAVGEVHAAILRAFHCEGVITNGAVRDLPSADKMRFPMFARYTAVSHAYAHIIEYGNKVEISGLEIRCGDLVMVDRHGALSIPLEIAADVPRVAAELRAKEQRIVALCASPDFSPEKLLQAIKSTQ